MHAHLVASKCIIGVSQVRKHNTQLLSVHIFLVTQHKFMVHRFVNDHGNWVVDAGEGYYKSVSTEEACVAGNLCVCWRFMVRNRV